MHCFMDKFKENQPPKQQQPAVVQSPHAHRYWRRSRRTQCLKENMCRFVVCAFAHQIDTASHRRALLPPVPVWYVYCRRLSIDAFVVRQSHCNGYFQPKNSAFPMHRSINGRMRTATLILSVDMSMKEDKDCSC